MTTQTTRLSFNVTECAMLFTESVVQASSLIIVHSLNLVQPLSFPDETGENLATAAWSLQIPDPGTQSQRAGATEPFGYVVHARSTVKGSRIACTGTMSVSPIKFSRLLAAYQAGRKPSRMDWIVSGTTEAPGISFWNTATTARLDLMDVNFSVGL